MVTRVCRHCGSITDYQTAAEVKGRIACPACGQVSVLLTEKQAEKLSEKNRNKERIKRELIADAERIRDNFSSIPIMAYDDYIGLSPFLRAVALGVSFPPGCTRLQAEELVKDARAQGMKHNPYVFEGFTYEQCDEFWSSKIPAYPNLIMSLLKFNICSSDPITALDGERIRKNLLRGIYLCPHCRHPQEWIFDRCDKCQRSKEGCLYRVAYRNGSMVFEGIISDGVLRIANGPTFQYVWSNNDRSGSAVKDLEIPGHLWNSSKDFGQFPVVLFRKDNPTLIPQEIKQVKKRKRMLLHVGFILLVAFIMHGGCQ